MDQVTVPRTGASPLQFVGDLIAKSEGHPFAHKPKSERRRCKWHDISLFKTQGGKYVLCISYRTEWTSTEKNYYHVAVIDTPQAVRNALRSWNPLEFAIGFGYDEEKNRREKEGLQQQYAERVSDILASSSEFIEVVQ